MKHPLLVEREKLEWKYLTDPQATEADKRAYLEADRKCREAGLLPKLERAFK